jgi:predicted AAA+ superfamily ATPase
VIIYGPRQVGKTTLLRAIQQKYPDQSVYMNCDEPDIRQSLQNKTSTELKRLLGNTKIVFIDEAQRVENIGLILKLIVDNYPETQIIATGSSAIELSDRIVEPLTGRKVEFYLYPFSLSELLFKYSRQELSRLLDTFMIHGLYPNAVLQNNPSDVITEIAGSYLYRDVLQYQTVKNSEVLHKLIQMLALQVGSEVSFNELGSALGVDKSTVARYIDLMEKAFIIFHLKPYSRNLCNELGKKRKIYFHDLGMRNALINNFNSMELRSDKGGLFENFFISERMKMNQNAGRRVETYFWRNYQGTEIDYLEAVGDEFALFECKWTRQSWNPPTSFTNAYGKSRGELINRQNILDYLLGDGSIVSTVK